MDIKTKHLSVRKTARYATYGRLSENTKYFWFCLHGSQMQCEQVLYKFSDFDPAEHFVVAPEALNRQYLKGFGGEAVATWMTSRDRLEEIEDFSNYLTTLYKNLGEQVPASCKKIILGFSQGGTTAHRWLHHSEISAEVLITYSGWIPEDIDLRQNKTDLDKLKLLYTYGTEDVFLSAERMDMQKKVISKNKLDIEILSYRGEHKIDKGQLAFLFESYLS